MTIRPFNAEADYPMVCEWWKARPDWQPLPTDHLSKFGFVAEQDGKPLAVIWLWLTGTAFAVLDFLVSNPDAPPKRKVRAMGELIDYALGIAQRAGAKSVFSSLKNEGLERFFCKHGFTVTDTGMTNLLARL